MSDQREFDRIRELLIRNGWRVVLGGKHWKGFPPDRTKSMLTWPCTPGRGRALANFKAQIRQRDKNIKF